MSYYDFRLKFAPANLPNALAALEALRTAGIITTGNLPENMLGLPFDASGNPDSETPAFYGSRGFAASTYTDESGQQHTAPARGDPAYWYVAIRTTTPPAGLPFDPAAYGLLPCDPTESAAVLGVWA